MRRFFGWTRVLAQKRVLLGLGGVGLFAVGLLAGMLTSGGIPAFAATSGPNTSTAGPSTYCQTYLNALASDLHVTPAQLQSANKDALQKTIDQMAADGKLTAAQKAKLEQRLNALSAHPCAALAARFKRGGAGARGALGPLGQAAHQQIEQAVTGALKMSTATLGADLAAGQTIPQIAQAQHVDLSTVNNAYLTAAKAALASAVGSGTLTQDQSNAAYAKLQQAVANGRYPPLERQSGPSIAPQA
jgi:hypothetical protein